MVTLPEMCVVSTGSRCSRIVSLQLEPFFDVDARPDPALARSNMYGAQAEHYPVVGAALLWTLEKGLGEAWTPPVADAWTAAYRTLSGFMISEAYGQKAA